MKVPVLRSWSTELMFPAELLRVSGTNHHQWEAYLLHGGGDTDDSWPTVGRAGAILDNLIAEHRAVPMIVVVPAGHISRTSICEPVKIRWGTTNSTRTLPEA